MPKQHSPLSPSKRIAFTAITILLPVMLVVLTEFLLRKMDYGGNLDLVITQQRGTEPYYTINRNVAQRYFTDAVSTVPEPADDSFTINKTKNTKRIFCLGESSMAGFPYEFQATPPSFLKDRLKVLLPQYEIEVVNVGLSAVGSFVVEDFMQELGSYHPDAYLIYLGHNEFYGVYGVGSTLGINGRPWITRLTIRLLKYKTFLVLRDGYLWLRTMFAPAQSSGGRSLMGEMVREQVIPYESELYQQAREIFKENVAAIIATARKQGVPVVFTSPVSNLRSQPPFLSVFDPRTTAAQMDAWSTCIAAGDSALGDNPALAASQYRRAIAIDSANAKAFFKLGQALYAMEQYADAAAAFQRAKDLDALRFRASEEFVHDLEENCSRHGAVFSPVDSAFANASPHGIIGSELMLEHLHPNIPGYFLMAKTWTQTMSSHGIPVPAGEWQFERDKSDEEYMDLSTVTQFDHDVGRIKVDIMTKKWPFEEPATPYRYKPRNPAERIVMRYLQDQTGWSTARYELATYYAGEKKYDLARKECLAVATVIPYSYQPLLKVADFYREEGKTADAKMAYAHCFGVEDNPFARMKLAIILIEEDSLHEAESQIARALEVERNGPHKFQQGAASSAQYLLGVIAAKQGKFPAARNHLLYALNINPANNEAKELLGKLPR